MKERLDIFLYYFIFSYVLLILINFISVGLPHNDIHAFIGTLNFNSCSVGGFGSIGRSCSLSYFNFLFLATLVSIRYLIYGKTHQK